MVNLSTMPVNAFEKVLGKGASGLHILGYFLHVMSHCQSHCLSLDLSCFMCLNKIFFIPTEINACMFDIIK